MNMSIIQTKLPYAEALHLAESVLADLAPACQRIEIAGSIRRQKSEVGDIEIVAIPLRLSDLEQTPLFGRDDSLSSALDKVVFTGGWRLIKNGSLYKQYDIGPCNLDLFLTTREKWGVIFTLRTGPADFSRNLVTSKRMGGLCPSYLRVKDGRVWNETGALSTPEEEDVFRVMNIRWIPPEKRI